MPVNSISTPPDMANREEVGGLKSAQNWKFQLGELQNKVPRLFGSD